MDEKVIKILDKGKTQEDMSSACLVAVISER